MHAAAIRKANRMHSPLRAMITLLSANLSIFCRLAVRSIPACFQTASTRGSGVADANAAVFPAEFVDHGAWTRAAANGIWMERFAGATLRAVVTC